MYRGRGGYITTGSTCKVNILCALYIPTPWSVLFGGKYLVVNAHMHTPGNGNIRLTGCRCYFFPPETTFSRHTCSGNQLILTFMCTCTLVHNLDTYITCVHVHVRKIAMRRYMYRSTTGMPRTLLSNYPVKFRKSS